MDDQEKQPSYRILLVIGVIAIVVALVWLLVLQLGKEAAPAESPSASPTSALDMEIWQPTSTPTEPEATKTAAPSQSPSASSTASSSSSPSSSPAPTMTQETSGMVAYDNALFSLSDENEVDQMKVLRILEEGQPVELQRILWQFNVEDPDSLQASWHGRTLESHDIVGTGTVFELLGEDGDVLDSAVAVIPGDVTGSGQLDDAQLAILTQALDDPDLLEGAYFLAADLDQSGEVDITDLRLLAQAIE